MFFKDEGVIDMDINTIAKLNTTPSVEGAGYGIGSKKTEGQSAVAGQQAGGQTEKNTAASVVELGSDRNAVAGYTKEQAGGAVKKGLTTDQVNALKADMQQSQQNMLKLMSSVLADNQARLAGVSMFNFGGTLLDASEFGLPSLAMTPEAAQQAIDEGGAYSVNSVADRIFGLAEKIAGGDPEKLQQMRSAVEKGFELAGVSFKKATGMDEMPEITGKTYAEIMSRFDKQMEDQQQPNPDAALE